MGGLRCGDVGCGAGANARPIGGRCALALDAKDGERARCYALRSSVALASSSAVCSVLRFALYAAAAAV
jgi:hypothetical protein